MTTFRILTHLKELIMFHRFRTTFFRKQYFLYHIHIIILPYHEYQSTILVPRFRTFTLIIIPMFLGIPRKKLHPKIK